MVHSSSDPEAKAAEFRRQQEALQDALEEFSAAVDDFREDPKETPLGYASAMRELAPVARKVAAYYWQMERYMKDGMGPAWIDSRSQRPASELSTEAAGWQARRLESWAEGVDSIAFQVESMKDCQSCREPPSQHHPFAPPFRSAEAGTRPEFTSSREHEGAVRCGRCGEIEEVHHEFRIDDHWRAEADLLAVRLLDDEPPILWRGVGIF